jgi:hypothetical protein
MLYKLMDENIGRSFSPLNVYDCYSTTNAAIDKWVVQTDSAHQRGLDTTLEEVLIVDALSSSDIRQLPLDIMQSTDPHSQPIIPSSQVPNDGNTSMLPSFANTDALSSSCIRQLPIACQSLTPSAIH